MATTLRFFDPADSGVEIFPAASGGYNTVGFYGAAFGLSIRVGDYNQSTYRTTEDGQSNGSALPNLEYANVTGAYVGGSITASHILEVLNSEATIRVQLTTDSAVQTQNTTFRTFDKTSIDNAPSGVDVFAAEIINELGPIGSGDSAWVQIYGSGAVLDLDDQTSADTTHNWWIGLTATPTSIGEKTNFAFYFETEFL